MSSKITIIRGDDESITIEFKDENDVAIDLTGSTVFFTVKNNDDLTTDNDSDALISKNVTSHSDPTGGITVITLTNSDTNLDAGNNYAYDIQIKDSGGLISSTCRGVLEIKEDVTKRTS